MMKAEPLGMMSPLIGLIEAATNKIATLIVLVKIENILWAVECGDRCEIQNNMSESFILESLAITSAFRQAIHNQPAANVWGVYT